MRVQSRCPHRIEDRSIPVPARPTTASVWDPIGEVDADWVASGMLVVPPHSTCLRCGKRFYGEATT